MGKDSKHQRTKGGVQPSSSARTAELLAKKGGAGGGALSFLAAAAEAQIQMEFGLKHGVESPGQSPSHYARSTAILVDDDLPPEVRLVFKKLQKKDAVTKIKALAELSTILGASPSPTPSSSREPSIERRNLGELEELSKIMLPHWVKAYQKLVLDDDRKVREAAQGPLGVICKLVGRALAPFLRELMPSWYLAQNDLYSPVGSAGRRAFASVFPSEAKQVDVVKFCKEDILKVIVEQLGLVFGGGKIPQNMGGRKDKKQKGKKKTDAEPSEPPEDTSANPPPDPNALKPVLDAESYALRLACATLQSLRSLIDAGQLSPDDDALTEVFGQGGIFWGSGDIGKESLVRRAMYDVLSSLVQNPSCSSFNLPSSLTSKFITSALSSTTQRECLPNLWNCFLRLTLHASIIEPAVAKRHLLLLAKSGFYGHASVLGPSALPLLTKLWAQKQSDLTQELVCSLIVGYGSERSLFEKAAIARTLGEVFGFLAQSDENLALISTPFYDFVFSHLGELKGGDFVSAFGENSRIYEEFTKIGVGKESFNSKNFGDFVVALCSSPPKISQNPSSRGFRRKVVKFKDDTESSNLSTKCFDSLSEVKQRFLLSVVKSCVSAHAYKPLAIIARAFQTPKLWDSIDVCELNISSEPDALSRLTLHLELIQSHPQLPALLASFGEEFDKILESQKPGEFRQFLSVLAPYTALPPIKRWVRSETFSSELETLLCAGNLAENELASVLKFVLNSELFPPEFIAKLLLLVVERLKKEDDVDFFLVLSHVLSSNTFSVNLSPIFTEYWTRYFALSVNSNSEEFELIESVCFRNLERFDLVEIAKILEHKLEVCDKLKELESLIEIAKKVGFSPELFTFPTPAPIFPKAELLSLLGFSYSSQISANEEISIQNLPSKNTNPHRFLSPTIFKAALTLENPESDPIIPLLAILQTQALAKIWEEGEKFYFTSKINKALSSKLDELSSRATEVIYAQKSQWKKLWEILPSQKSILWDSGLPLRVLDTYCAKSELIKPKNIEKDEKFPEDFESQVNFVLSSFSRNEFKVSDLIPWITDGRKGGAASAFEFETLFKHIKNKQLVTSLLTITTETLRKIDNNSVENELEEEFLSLGSCWIAGWLKGTKNITISSKIQLLFVSKLAKSVKTLGDAARNGKNGKFVQEFVEFHAATLYPVIYAHFLQLTEIERDSHNFWSLGALFYVAEALVCIPSNTLAFIEPDGGRLCEIFGGILGNGVSLPARIAAYRLLRKVNYDTGGEGELPIVPPVIGSLIPSLLAVIKREQDDANDTALTSYLLMWDALLKIQQGSNQFATYVRDEPHLLSPFLNILFFSERISLEDATTKCFEKEAELKPGNPVVLLSLACTVVQRTLRTLPYTVRWWWNNEVQKQRDRVFVEKFIVKHLSAKLAAEELGSVKLRDGVDDNVTVHCHSGCNELIAHYRIEETNVTLTVSLPLNHPLGPVTVKISDKKLHGRITHLLNTRSHSLSAGLKLWKENLDGLYKDVDECAICFFILHNVTKQIPKLGCKTCKKKFHAACLYKWFSTSNKSECPLCRNLF